MDNLAHTLIGIGVARAGLSRRCGPGTTATLAIASNLPDLDILWTIWDPWNRFMLRRTHTHALLMLPVLAALLAWALGRRYREQMWKALFGLSLLGIGLHVLFDLVNSFGVVLFWPFSRMRLELASVFIIDVVIWGLTALPIAAGRFLKSDRSRERAYRMSLCALGVYLVLCLAAHARAQAQVREELARRSLPVRTLVLFPEPLGPQRFRAAARVGDDWNIYLCNLLRGTSELREVVPTRDTDPRALEVRAGKWGRELDWFMAAPVWTPHPDGLVDVYDLRFRSQVVPRAPTFHVEFPPGRIDPVVR